MIDKAGSASVYIAYTYFPLGERNEAHILNA